MAVTTTLFNSYLNSLPIGPINLEGATLKLLLLTSDWVPNMALAARYELGHEVANGAGYLTGGRTLDVVTAHMDDVGHISCIYAEDVVWASLSRIFRYGVLYDAVSQALILMIDFGEDQDPAAGSFTVEWAAPESGGILNFAGA